MNSQHLRKTAEALAQLAELHRLEPLHAELRFGSSDREWWFRRPFDGCTQLLCFSLVLRRPPELFVDFYVSPYAVAFLIENGLDRNVAGQNLFHYQFYSLGADPTVVLPQAIELAQNDPPFNRISLELSRAIPSVWDHLWSVSLQDDPDWCAGYEATSS